MVLMVLLCVLVAAGFVAVWRWGGLDVEAPWAGDGSWPLRPLEAARRFLWYATVAVTAGLTAGIVMLGAGGRLAMRLLAMTAGSDAQGRLTEADEIVGTITTGGTLGFIGFIGIVGGTFLGIVYMVARPWLPKGRWGGFTFGCILLVVTATRADPLRPENRDFDIVGPGWLSIAVFSLVVVGYGMLVAAVAGRYSTWLPLLEKRVRTVVRYLPAYLVWGPAAFVLAVPLVVGAGGAILVGRTDGLRSIALADRTRLVGRIAGLLLLAVALPGFAVGVADIATRG